MKSEEGPAPGSTLMFFFFAGTASESPILIFPLYRWNTQFTETLVLLHRTQQERALVIVAAARVWSVDHTFFLLSCHKVGDYPLGFPLKSLQWQRPVE